MCKFLFTALLLFGLTGCSHQRTNYLATAWPEADQLFRRDSTWVGADDAYSISLGDNRALWLFADTFIDTTHQQNRRAAKLIRNSVAIQTVDNPVSAQIAFFWNKNDSNQPASFFSEQNNEWFWPGHGIRLQNRLIIFLMRVRGATTGLGFEVYAWDAVLILNPDDSPANWKLQWLNSPTNAYQVIVGSASVLQMGQHVYAFGSRESGSNHPVFLTRWPANELANGELSGIEWWDAARGTWVRQADLKNIPPPVFENGQTEFTVHFDPRLNRYFCIQTLEFGAANIYYRLANKITGPWSEPIKLYEPLEKSHPHILIYAAKAHPQLSGADLLITYATNSTEFSELLNNASIYYPRFIRVKFEIAESKILSSSTVSK